MGPGEHIDGGGGDPQWCGCWHAWYQGVFACVPERSTLCIPWQGGDAWVGLLASRGAGGYCGQDVSAPCLTCQLLVGVPPADSFSLPLLEAGFICSQG